MTEQALSRFHGFGGRSRVGPQHQTATATAGLEGKTPEQVDVFANAVPLERLGTPGDIAEAVAFVTSAAGHWVNGQTIRVNGGLH